MKGSMARRRPTGWSAAGGRRSSMGSRPCWRPERPCAWRRRACESALPWSSEAASAAALGGLDPHVGTTVVIIAEVYLPRLTTYLTVLYIGLDGSAGGIDTDG